MLPDLLKDPESEAITRHRRRITEIVDLCLAVGVYVYLILSLARAFHMALFANKIHIPMSSRNRYI